MYAVIISHHDFTGFLCVPRFMACLCDFQCKERAQIEQQLSQTKNVLKTIPAQKMKIIQGLTLTTVKIKCQRQAFAA